MDGATVPLIVIWLIALGALVFCLRQFLDLMSRRDDQFPGRYDKLIWAAAIILTNVLGAFAYWMFKSKPAPESNESLRRHYAAIKRESL
jgi:hypothetical protein